MVIGIFQEKVWLEPYAELFSKKRHRWKEFQQMLHVYFNLVTLMSTGNEINIICTHTHTYTLHSNNTSHFKTAILK